MRIERAFEIDALLLGGAVGLIAGSADPSIALEEAPIGTLYLRDNGEIWQKIGEVANQWKKRSKTLGSSVINFGAFASRKNVASVVVTGQAAVAADSEVKVWMPETATADHNAEEHRVCGVRLRVGVITAGIGFTIHALSGVGRDYGQFNVNWSY